MHCHCVDYYSFLFFCYNYSLAFMPYSLYYRIGVFYLTFLSSISAPKYMVVDLCHVVVLRDVDEHAKKSYLRLVTFRPPPPRKMSSKTKHIFVALFAIVRSKFRETSSKVCLFLSCLRMFTPPGKHKKRQKNVSYHYIVNSKTRHTKIPRRILYFFAFQFHMRIRKKVTVVITRHF